MSGRRLASWLLAFVAALAVVPPAAGGPKLFFGFADDAPKWHGAAAGDAARALGAKAFRITLQWAPGRTGLTPSDVEAIDRALAATPGMRLVVAVFGERAVYAPQDEAAREQYCGYVRDLLTRYRAINDVVIWNEPNISLFWQPQFNPDKTSAAPAAYYALIARCWDVLHAARPGVNVIGPATSPIGWDNPDGPSNISHSPGNFIRRLGEAYRASGRAAPLFETVGHNVYGSTPAERPWHMHPSSPRISQGDWDKLVRNHELAFAGTAQPVPGQCVGGRCVAIWYLESGFQTAIDPHKAALYSERENVAPTVPDSVGGELDLPPPFADSPAPDQATQLADGLRLAYCQPHVEAYLNFLLWDEPDLRAWQSAPFWADRTPKDSYAALRRAVEQVNAGKVDCAKFTVPPLPLNTAPPTIAGTAESGQLLSATSGAWKTPVPLAYTYEWQACDAAGSGCRTIPGGAGPTYTLTPLDAGFTVRVRVTASTGSGSTSATSAPSAVVVATPAPQPPLSAPPPPQPPSAPPAAPAPPAPPPPPAPQSPSAPAVAPLVTPAVRVDTTPPSVRALASVGTRGKRVRLRYTARDDSGTVMVVATVLRGGKVAWKANAAVASRSAGFRTLTWLAPRRARGRWAFCVAAHDRSGNTGARSCARLTLR